MPTFPLFDRKRGLGGDLKQRKGKDLKQRQGKFKAETGKI